MHVRGMGDWGVSSRKLQSTKTMINNHTGHQLPFAPMYSVQFGVYGVQRSRGSCLYINAQRRSSINRRHHPYTYYVCKYYSATDCTAVWKPRVHMYVTNFLAILDKYLCYDAAVLKVHYTVRVQHRCTEPCVHTLTYLRLLWTLPQDSAECAHTYVFLA